MRQDNLYELPANLPVPQDDGACDHLRGAEVPDIWLPATDGTSINLHERPKKWTVVYCYPHTGVPNKDPDGGLEEWNAIPGARGCTPQTCTYRDRFREIADLGGEVFGLSTQSREYQQEMVARLHVPFPVLSDERFELIRRLRLPTFEHSGTRFVRRLTLILHDGRIHHCNYPVFPPDRDAQQVIELLKKYEPVA